MCKINCIANQNCSKVIKTLKKIAINIHDLFGSCKIKNKPCDIPFHAVYLERGHDRYLTKDNF